MKLKSGSNRRKRVRRRAHADAFRMTESAEAFTRPAVRIRRDVENDVVGVGRIGNPTDPSKVIELQEVAQAPRDVVIRAGRVAAESDASEQTLTFAVKSEAAAEDVYAADFLAHQWIVRRPKETGWTFVRRVMIYGIAFLQAEEAASGLNGRIKICRRQGQAVRSARAAAG